MPLTKTADRYRGRARSKQKTIDWMGTPPTPPAAGEWPADPADALASWCAENLIVPHHHPPCVHAHGPGAETLLSLP